MQVRTRKYLIAVGGLVFAAACADDQPATKVTMPARVSAVISPTCDFTKLKKDARAYFVSSNDAVYGLIQQLASLNRGTSGDAFNAKAYEILAYVGSVAGTSAVTTNTSAGDAFIGDVFTCLGIATTAGTFTPALGPNGLFGVRGDVPDFVLSRGTPKYGAQPATGATWKTSANLATGPLPPGVQLVVYGYPRDVDDFTGEPALIPDGYELFTIPGGLSFAPGIIGGVCLTTIPSQARLLHEHNGRDVILAPVTPPFCGPLTASAPNEARGVFALVHRVSDWIAPKPLYASTMVLGGMGGSLGGLSPIGPVTTNAATVKLTITQQPTTGFINTPLDNPAIRVEAVTANNTPLDGLTIRLDITGNNGNWTVKEGTNIAVTQNGGVATFPNLEVNKAGGYTFVAIGAFDIANGPYSAPSGVSLMINVSGQPQQ